MRKLLMFWVFMVLNTRQLVTRAAELAKSNLLDIKFSCSRLQHNDRRVGSNAESEICRSSLPAKPPETERSVTCGIY